MAKKPNRKTYSYKKAICQQIEYHSGALKHKIGYSRMHDISMTVFEQITLQYIAITDYQG
jgi:hypothetical protein